MFLGTQLIKYLNTQWFSLKLVHSLKFVFSLFSLQSSHLLNGWTVQNDFFYLEFIQNSTCVSFSMLFSFHSSTGIRETLSNLGNNRDIFRPEMFLIGCHEHQDVVSAQFLLTHSEPSRVFVGKYPLIRLTGLYNSDQRRERRERSARHDFAQNCRDMVNQSLPLSAYSRPRPRLMNSCGFLLSAMSTFPAISKESRFTVRVSQLSKSQFKVYSTQYFSRNCICSTRISIFYSSIVYRLLLQTISVINQHTQ